jgi:hypothetical protein
MGNGVDGTAADVTVAADLIFSVRSAGTGNGRQRRLGMPVRIDRRFPAIHYREAEKEMDLRGDRRRVWTSQGGGIKVGSVPVHNSAMTAAPPTKRARP